MNSIVEGFEESVKNLLLEIYKLKPGDRLKINKLNWSFEMLETVCQHDNFTFGLVLLEEEDEWEIKVIEDKLVASVVRSLLKHNGKSSQFVGIEFQNKMEDLKKRVFNIINKYFSETIEETNKSDYFKYHDEMKRLNVISKTYITRRLGPYVYANKKIIKSGHSGIKIIDLVFESLIKENLIVELTEEQCLPFETKAKLYGVFR